MQRSAAFFGHTGMKKTLSILLLMAVLGQACKKHHDQPTVPENVYVTGDDGHNPILWSNGKTQILATDGGYGSQVLLDGSDVYVGGISNPPKGINFAGPSGQFTIWKNGAASFIGTPSFIRDPIAIALSGSDVYYSCGQVYKNGSLEQLPGIGIRGYVSAAMAVGNDVYLAGDDSAGDGVYWKNGVLNVAAVNVNPSNLVDILSIYVSGNDVYIGGTDTLQRAAIWKNGIETPISNFGGQAIFNIRAIFVDATGAVYSTGNWVVGGTNAPAYWKDGVQVNLPLNGAAYGNATSISVSGDDVYVAGNTAQGAVLWKNGAATLLAAGGEANSVVMKPQ